MTMTRSDGLTIADDWASESLRRLMRDPRRREKLARERHMKPADAQLWAERNYDNETEHLRRFLRGQAVIEMRKTA